MSNIINYIEYGFMAMSYCNREGINNCKTNEVNPLNPNFKIQILICYSYTFSIEVVGRICWSINLDSSCVIMSLILMTTLFYKAVILHGEIWRWSLLGLKGLISLEYRLKENHLILAFLMLFHYLMFYREQFSVWATKKCSAQ